MRRVYKYSLGRTLRTNPVLIAMPPGATILTLQMQEDTPTMWALVDPDEPVVMRSFVVVGTGWDIEDDSLAYVGTYQHGHFVWHLFENQPNAVPATAPAP